jgi:hypothetical protein
VLEYWVLNALLQYSSLYEQSALTPVLINIVGAGPAGLLFALGGEKKG